jgi:hypothetical protein
LSIREVERKSGLMLGKHFPLLSVEEAERKSGMGELPASYRIREEVRNKKGNIFLSCQLRKQRGIQEWVSFLSVTEAVREVRNSGGLLSFLSIVEIMYTAPL